MTIPELTKRINEVDSYNEKLNERIKQLENDLQQLRGQLGVERLPDNVPTKDYIAPSTGMREGPH